MRLPSQIKPEVLAAAVLAGFGLLSTAFRRTGRTPRASGPVADNLDAWHEELHVLPRASARADDAGSGATSPLDIPPRGWWQIAKRVFVQFNDHRIMTEAAGVTFYALLAIFPALGALISLYGLVADPNTVANDLNAVNGLVPGGGMDILRDQLKTLTTSHSGTLSFGAIFGLLVALWSANGGTKSLFDALNIVYDEKEKRSYLRRTMLSLCLTAGGLLFLVLAMATVVGLPIALSYIGLNTISDTLLRIIRWPVMLVIISMVLAVLFRYGPSRTEPRWRWVSWGGVTAAVLWVLVSVAFSWYVANFGSYNKTYGSLGAAIGFMTWIWISAMVVLIGAEIDAELEHQVATDTTVGPEKPPGARGATKADQVAAK